MSGLARSQPWALLGCCRADGAEGTCVFERPASTLRSATRLRSEDGASIRACQAIPDESFTFFPLVPSIRGVNQLSLNSGRRLISRPAETISSVPRRLAITTSIGAARVMRSACRALTRMRLLRTTTQGRRQIQHMVVVVDRCHGSGSRHKPQLEPARSPS